MPRSFTPHLILASGLTLLLSAGTARPDPLPVLGPSPLYVPTIPPETPLGPPPGQGAASPVPPGALPATKPVHKRQPARETALENSPIPTFEPDTLDLTLRASERYAAVANAGGWPEIPAALHIGERGTLVALLRRRLEIEGDLPVDNTSNPQVWTPDLTAAVKYFQARHGLRQTGAVAGATLKEMNVPASVRAQQLSASAARLSGMSFTFGARYVVVNLPSASVEAVEDGMVVHRYIAVVGNVEHPSPQEIAHITAINLNPTWTLPTSIIKNEVIPKMRTDPTYLSRAHIRIFDGNGQEVDPARVNWNSERATLFTLRQDAGTSNSLGTLRIQMPNRDAVYMHDTPAKALFSGDYRFFSHGCVRVEGVYGLASWLLENTPAADNRSWDVATIRAAIGSQGRMDIRLARSVPVAWVYLTGWAKRDGTVEFRPDVYGLDAQATVAKPETPPQQARTSPSLSKL